MKSLKLKVEITAIDLQIDHEGRVWVRVEIDNEWITIIGDIRYSEGCIVSHIVEGRGILASKNGPKPTMDYWCCQTCFRVNPRSRKLCVGGCGRG